jgi:hypothetical protein
MIRCTWRSGTPVTDAASFAVISVVWFAATGTSKILPRFWKHISHKDPLCQCVRLSALPFGVGLYPSQRSAPDASICLRARHNPERKGEMCSRAPRPTGSAGHSRHRKWRTRAIRPQSQRPRSADTPVHKFVVTNRILALCPFHFSATQNAAAPAKMRRSLSFVAAALSKECML